MISLPSRQQTRRDADRSTAPCESRFVPRITARMVGPPKTLYDLRKVEAALRVTCRACKAARLVDREELIHFRLSHRLPLDWATVRGDQRCDGCNGTDVRVDGVPFGEGNAALRARRGEVRRMNLALQVLNEGAARNSAVPAAAIQLALRVLHPFVGDQALLVTYWDQVAARSDRPWGGGHQALRWIVTRLVERRWPVWAEFR